MLIMVLGRRVLLIRRGWRRVDFAVGANDGSAGVRECHSREWMSLLRKSMWMSL